MRLTTFLRIVGWTGIALGAALLAFAVLAALLDWTSGIVVFVALVAGFGLFANGVVAVATASVIALWDRLGGEKGSLDDPARGDGRAPWGLSAATN